MAYQAQKGETERQEKKEATVYKGEVYTLTLYFDNPVSSGTVTVDWRDGEEGTLTFSGRECLMRHVYTTAGIFTVQFSIKDNKGCSITDTNTVTVLEPTQNDDQDVSNTSLEELRETIAAALGREGSTEEKHLELIDQATNLVLKRIFIDTVEKLSEQDAEVYANLIEADASPEYINKFLNKKIAGYDEFTKQIIDAFLNKLKEAGESTTDTNRTQNDDKSLFETCYIDLPKRIAVVLGMEGSTEKEYLEIIDRANDTISQTIFLETLRKLSHQDVEEYRKLMEVEASPEYIYKFLNTRIPGYGAFTNKIIDDCLNELK